ncbi:hypothetical protein ACH5RR_015532 [Cinchona calisaya]|uniref:Uncharacterized protein n=1 Tax=Cinchona calisaya TaxID=153742 RepID=A0ABD2ZUM9_9GENT
MDNPDIMQNSSRTCWTDAIESKVDKDATKPNHNKFVELLPQYHSKEVGQPFDLLKVDLHQNPNSSKKQQVWVPKVTNNCLAFQAGSLCLSVAEKSSISVYSVIQEATAP